MRGERGLRARPRDGLFSFAVPRAKTTKKKIPWEVQKERQKEKVEREQKELGGRGSGGPMRQLYTSKQQHLSPSSFFFLVFPARPLRRQATRQPGFLNHHPSFYGYL